MSRDTIAAFTAMYLTNIDAAFSRAMPWNSGNEQCGITGS